MKEKFKKTLLKGISLFMAGSFLSMTFPEKSSAVTCSTVYIDNDDPNWVNIFGGTWSSRETNYNAYRDDQRTNYGSAEETHEWGDFTEISQRVCGAVQNIDVHLWDVKFTDPAADYAIMTGEYTRQRVKILNQETAKGGWTWIGAVTTARPIVIQSSDNPGKNTGVDGVRLRPAN